MIYLKKLSLAFACGLLLAGCAGSSQSTLPNEVAPFGPTGASQDFAHGLLANAKPEAGTPCCVYVSQYDATSLLEYNYQGTGSPLCTLDGITNAWSIQTDPKHELIVPTANGVYIYKESQRTCLPSSPEKQITVYGGIDGYSPDGRHYYILTNDNYIEACKFGRRPGCKRTPLSSHYLRNGYAVTADSSGVYAVSASNYGNGASLVYWAGAKGGGTLLGGYVNLFGGGIYFDGFHNLLAIDGSTQSSALYVYSGCPSACEAHGPFPLVSAGVAFGALNLGETRFMTVSVFGVIDVYQYNGTYGLTYLYSNTTGLSQSAYPIGIAQYK